jgi:hypothetical protein
MEITTLIIAMLAAMVAAMLPLRAVSRPVPERCGGYKRMRSEP